MSEKRKKAGDVPWENTFDLLRTMGYDVVEGFCWDPVPGTDYIKATDPAKRLKPRLYKIDADINVSFEPFDNEADLDKRVNQLKKD